MTFAALFAWVATALFGLLLLIIWLMEYDREFQSAAETRLPVPVISAHALLGVGGLLLWAMYLLADEERLAWAAVADLAAVALLGVIMAVRWIGVYRTFTDPNPSHKVVKVPPERHFPPPVVVTHGALAATTIALVLLTVLAPGGS